MSKASSPTRPADTWKGGFVTPGARDVRAVNARGGLIVAGGTDLYLALPGVGMLKTRPPPDGFGYARAAAAEMRGARRYAFASEGVIAIFYQDAQGDQLLHLRAPPGDPGATHLAWGVADGPTTLHLRRADGLILRLHPDMGDFEELEIPPAHALASDNDGVMAIICLEPEPRVYIMRDTEIFHYRRLDLGVDLDPSQPLHLAVAGMAVAISSPGAGTFVSRGEDYPFERCAPLAAAGPIEFEGVSHFAAVFGAVPEGNGGAVVRVEADGTAERIAEYGGEGPERIELTALSWDVTRRMLWGASPQAGLLTARKSVGRQDRQEKKVLLS